MENHPIPQDITGFKFKLIGSITIKQFLYLLAGGAIALIVYLLPGEIAFKLPFMLTFFGIGAALAFLPIEGRPMDIMLINFIKALPSENQYIYKKRGVNFAHYVFLQPPKPTAPIKETSEGKNDSDTKRALLLNQLRSHYDRPDEKELVFLKNIKGYFDTEKVNNIPVTNLTPKADELPQNELEEKLEPLAQQTVPAQATTEPETIVSEEAPVALFTPLENTAPIEQVTPVDTNNNARTVIPESQIRAGFPTLPDVPNIILGIVKDPRGRVLPNILVEVIDQNNVPVRAFKTNALGQFASATPLPAGTYRVFFDDAQKVHEFEPTEITLTNQIFNPLEIFSIDQREKLRQELFGTSMPTNIQQPIATI
jgi:hypothetical protein